MPMKKIKNQIQHLFISLWCSAFFLLLGGGFSVSATPNNLHIIPEKSWTDAEVRADIQTIGNPNAWGSVLERYDRIANQLDAQGDLGGQLQRGTLTRNSLLNYASYLMKFLSQLGLLIGGIMILYAGYQYATTIFGYGSPSNAKAAISNAIIWVIVIVASYAIWRGLISLLL